MENEEIIFFSSQIWLQLSLLDLLRKSLPSLDPFCFLNILNISSEIVWVVVSEENSEWKESILPFDDFINDFSFR